MDPKSHLTLELPKVLEALAGFAAFSASKMLARQLEPSGDFDVVRQRLRATAEARQLLDSDESLSVGGARDVRPQIQAAQRDAVLEPQDFLDVKATLISARRLRRTLLKRSEDLPVLASLAEVLQPPEGLIDAVSSSLDERGKVLDQASDKLRSIRSQLSVGRERLMSKLERMLGDPKLASMLQESLITQRQGRYVIPLRAEFKGQIKAVVHDQSASGATLFVEPLQVVDLNNAVRELELAERDEIRRILLELSARVGEHAEALTQTVDALAEMDLTFAKARYAEHLEATEPGLLPFRPRGEDGHPGSSLKLLAARHPLLDPTGVVPIDIFQDEHTYVLVITGPNTGGKTVALKTAGLLALMAQCGLHLPAAQGSQVSVFSSVFADIGDEQSIEQSLSTFSAHIANIVRVLKRADSGSLVLLDELGAGTDPLEGAALARAILEELVARGATTLVATHYPELKIYAHATPGVGNASVEFDLESLQPTYHLTIGLPGRSNALAIAERLGLSQAIVDRARGGLSREEAEVESLLEAIREERNAAAGARRQAQRAEAEVDALQKRLRQRLADLDHERRAVLEQARGQAEAELKALRQAITELKDRLKEAVSQPTTIEDVEARADSLASELPEVPAGPEIEVEALDRPVHVGDRVRVHSLDAEGVVKSLGQEEAEIQLGRLRVRSPLADLVPLASGGGRGQPTESIASERYRPDVQAPASEIDLRGMSAEEALMALERHLDAAFLAGMPYLRVIHGKGTGRLRAAVRRALSDNAYVDRFEPGRASEGGQGVTILHLANR